MDRSRLLQADTSGWFELHIKNWTQMKNPYGSKMKDRVCLQSAKTKCLERVILGLLQREGLLVPLFVSGRGR